MKLKTLAFSFEERDNQNIETDERQSSHWNSRKAAPEKEGTITPSTTQNNVLTALTSYFYQ